LQHLLVSILVVLALALVQPVQETGCTQTSQLALTRAFASGTARIDRWQQTTCDKAWFHNHYYSVKARARRGRLAGVSAAPERAPSSAQRSDDDLAPCAPDRGAGGPVARILDRARG
jgi:hypothetical protein